MKVMRMCEKSWGSWVEAVVSVTVSEGEVELSVGEIAGGQNYQEGGVGVIRMR